MVAALPRCLESAAQGCEEIHPLNPGAAPPADTFRNARWVSAISNRTMSKTARVYKVEMVIRSRGQTSFRPLANEARQALWAGLVNFLVKHCSADACEASAFDAFMVQDNEIVDVEEAVPTIRFGGRNRTRGDAGGLTLLVWCLGELRSKIAATPASQQDCNSLAQGI